MKRTFFLRAAAAAAAAALISGAAMAENILMQTGGKTYSIALLDNDAARSFASQLPLKLRFEDYGEVERVAYLKEKLATGSAPKIHTPSRGELNYYAPWGNLCAFTGPFRRSPGLVPLGRMSGEAIEALRGSGSSEVVFRKP
ncbi:cyclophilin-like fold protein [Mesosutterella sp. AGMB02718]|uniref:Cyclophilin-like fold protein n=1 Tax=Mesosutterella faecium TaxID=2925194 RepID=A0ABT7IQ29_9BURK|nr:cyclophilin-like fold protein [Mesosutterella sp. AGMB02718]MDL2060003.1 cyclophilin-like fold protein [Mesosutterella sp. AGMB02718]